MSEYVAPDRYVAEPAAAGVFLDHAAPQGAVGVEVGLSAGLTVDSAAKPAGNPWGAPAGPSALGVEYGTFEQTRRCAATTKAGNPCPAMSVAGRRLCSGHEKQAAAAASKVSRDA